jgi:hypothetical protein
MENINNLIQGVRETRLGIALISIWLRIEKDFLEALNNLSRR